MTTSESRGLSEVVIGLPGAFTPVCSAKHVRPPFNLFCGFAICTVLASPECGYWEVPGYLTKLEHLKKKGVGNSIPSRRVCVARDAQ